MSRLGSYGERILVVLLLVVVFPVGVYKLWMSDRFSNVFKILLSGLPMFFVIGTYVLFPLVSSNRTTDSGRLAPLQSQKASAEGFATGFMADASGMSLDTERSSNNFHFFRFNTDYGFGEKVPSSVTVSGSSRSTSKTYLTCGIHTSEMQLPVSWHTGIFVSYIVFFALSCLVCIAIFEWKLCSDWKCALVIIFFLVGNTAALGYLSGSRLILDNATGKAIEVRLNGEQVAELRPYSYIETRVVESALDVEVLEDGRLLESGKLVLDSEAQQIVLRAILGRGVFVYNVGAENSYSVGVANYSR